jgi:hypothetical protein
LEGGARGVVRRHVLLDLREVRREPSTGTTIELIVAGNRKAGHTPFLVYLPEVTALRPNGWTGTMDLCGWIGENIGRTACGEQGACGAESCGESEEIHLANIGKRARGEKAGLQGSEEQQSGGTHWQTCEVTWTISD